MVSEKQLKANKENAILGGVKTSEGKETSKFNALTHGILRQSITDYEKGFYSKIIEELEEYYQPIGITEQILVERIAIYYLKLFRAQTAETEFVKSKLNPRVVKTEVDSSLEKIAGEEIVVNEGYIPQITDETIQKLMEIYARYETTIENRLFRAIHELERAQRLRKGEKVFPPITADLNQMGLFGEND